MSFYSRICGPAIRDKTSGAGGRWLFLPREGHPQASAVGRGAVGRGATGGGPPQWWPGRW
jgi:hypothetical protein